MATFLADAVVVFFPSWVSMESAIGHSPLLLDDSAYHFSNWVEVGEDKRGLLRHKAWIRLRNWPCWSEAEVKAAISDFGELWEVDALSSGVANVTFFGPLSGARTLNVYLSRSF